MPASVTAGSVRRYEPQEPGYSKLLFKYLKKNVDVAKLRIEILDASGVVQGYADVDVSSQAINTEASYSVDVTNGLTAVSLTAVAHTTVSTPAYGTATYTAPADQYAVITPGSTEVTDDKGVNLGMISVIVPPGVKVSLYNASSVGVTQDVYLFSKADVDAIIKTLTVRVKELKADGTVLFQYTASITDIPPFSIGGEGTTTIYAIL